MPKPVETNSAAALVAVLEEMVEAHGRKTLASEYDRFMALYANTTRRE